MDQAEFEQWLQILKIDHINFKQDVHLTQDVNPVNGGNGILRRAREYQTSNGNEIIMKHNKIRDIREEIVLLGILQDQPLTARLFGITTDEEGALCMIMEYAPNGNLRDYIARESRNLSTKRKVYLAKGIAEGLTYIHQNGVLHRDLHSGNILIDNARKPLITDFGLSRQLHNIHSDKETAGILPYISPEVLQGQPFTFLADIYSLGVIMWEIFANRRPFRDRQKRDADLKNAIIRGVREQPLITMPKSYVRLYSACWSDLQTMRPSTTEIVRQLDSLIKDNTALAKMWSINPVNKLLAFCISRKAYNAGILTTTTTTTYSNISYTTGTNPLDPLSDWKKDNYRKDIHQKRVLWDSHGISPPPLDVFHSALTGDIVALKWFLEHEGDQCLQYRDVFNLTPLHYAAFASEPFPILEFLLQHGADPMATSASGETPIRSVLIAPLDPPESLRCLNLLHRYGGRLDLNDIENQRKLHFNTHPLYVLQQGVDKRRKLDTNLAINLHMIPQDWKLPSDTPKGMDGDQLVYICNKVIYILKHDSSSIFNDTNGVAAKLKYFTTTLFFAIACTNADIKTLISLKNEGVDVNAKDNDGRTALHFIAANGANIESMQWLLKNGVDKNVVDAGGMTPLHVVATYSDNTRAIQFLVENGANVNAVTEYNWTALKTIARYHDSVEAIRVLLESGADVNTVSKERWTALHSATRYHGNTETIRLLLENGADVNATTESNWTALHLIARYYDNIEAMRLLIEKGANVNAITIDGDTPLHLASRRKDGVKGIQFLIENGGDINAKNDDGKTASDYTTEIDNY